MTKPQKIEGGKKVMKDSYRRLESKQVLDIIFQGTMHSWGNMIKWVENFREDKRKGKFK